MLVSEMPTHPPLRKALSTHDPLARGAAVVAAPEHRGALGSKDGRVGWVLLWLLGIPLPLLLGAYLLRGCT